MNSNLDRLLSVNQDASSCAALFVDGRLEFAAAEERFSRIRFHSGRPARTIAEIKRRYRIEDDDINAVAVGNLYSFVPQALIPVLEQREPDFFGPGYKAYFSFQEMLWRLPASRRPAEKLSRVMLEWTYPRLAHVSDHHTAHAYSAYLTSGFDEATAITADGFGDGASTKVFRCSAGRCQELYGTSAFRSVGIFYGEIAQLLGIDCRLAGKVTGMAAFGDPAPAYPLMARLISLSPDGHDFEVLGLTARRRGSSPYKKLLRFKREDVAAAAQKRLEDVFIPYIRNAISESGYPDVVVAGGVFGNVKLNQRIVEQPEVGRFFVHPAMNDHGIAVGAGLEHLAISRGIRPTRLPNVFLGTDYTDEECALALEAAGLRFREEPDIDARVAALLADGKIVARFAGRMEYGPRALGNRSILYRANDPGVNDWLNRMLRRKEYMPFAPVTLAEHAAACYGDLSRIEECVRFMTIAVPCSEPMRRISPGAIHVDGTARPQVIHEADNPGYYRIVRLCHEMTGIPSLVNTSFNMHEEPIVCTPGDACRALLASGLPYLAINRFLAVGPGAELPPRS